MKQLRGFERVGGLERYLQVIEEFHGILAPGIIIGGFMVDFCVEPLKTVSMIDCIVETGKCLPDAIQILTPCSVGNGWMKILDHGKFALTCYDKETGLGYRVRLNYETMQQYSSLHDWFFKRVPKFQNPLEGLNKEATEAGRSILVRNQVLVEMSRIKKIELAKPRICPICHESFRSPGTICKNCKDSYYTPTEAIQRDLDAQSDAGQMNISLCCYPK